MPLLSICIPTYNRHLLLINTVNMLIHQINGNSLNDHVEIIISDNASTDDTLGSCKVLVENNLNVSIRHFRNPSNIGFDRNCLAATKFASGEFVWLMSDDDKLNDDAIIKIYDSLKENSDVVFAFINYSLITPGFDEYFPLRFSKNLLLTADELVIKTQLGFGFVTSCIFKRKIWEQLNLEGYLGSNWLQLYAVKDAALFGKSLVIAEPLIKMIRGTLLESRIERRSKDQKIDLFMQFHLDYLDYLETYIDSGYKSSTYPEIIKTGWNDNLNQIISMKLTAATYNLSGLIFIFSKMKFFYRKKLAFWFLHVPILFMPKSFARLYFGSKMLKIRAKRFVKPYLIRLGFLKSYVKNC